MHVTPQGVCDACKPTQGFRAVRNSWKHFLLYDFTAAHLLFIFLSYIKVDLNYCSHQAISSQLEQGVHPKDDSILILTKYRLQLFVNVFDWLTMKAVHKISFKQSIHSVTELFHSRIPNNSFKRLQQCLLTISALSSVTGQK